MMNLIMQKWKLKLWQVIKKLLLFKLEKMIEIYLLDKNINKV